MSDIDTIPVTTPVTTPATTPTPTPTTTPIGLDKSSSSDDVGPLADFKIDTSILDPKFKELENIIHRVQMMKVFYGTTNEGMMSWFPKFTHSYVRKTYHLDETEDEAEQLEKDLIEYLEWYPIALKKIMGIDSQLADEAAGTGENSTTPSTIPTSEPLTEPETEPGTTSSTEPLTEPLTEPATAPATEPSGDPGGGGGGNGGTNETPENPTEAPTEAPTEGPTSGDTEAPTEAPTTAEGDTEAPTTAEGDTEAPTTAEGDTEAPTTAEGDTEAPTTAEGDTEAPTTGSTEAPTTAPTTPEQKTEPVTTQPQQQQQQQQSPPKVDPGITSTSTLSTPLPGSGSLATGTPISKSATSSGIDGGKSGTSNSTSEKSTNTTKTSSTPASSSYLAGTTNNNNARVVPNVTPGTGLTGEKSFATHALTGAGLLIGAAGVAGGLYLATRNGYYIFTPEDWEDTDEYIQAAILQNFREAGMTEAEIQEFMRSTYRIKASELNEHIKKVEKGLELNPNIANDFIALYRFSIFDDVNEVDQYLMFIIMAIDGMSKNDSVNFYNILNPLFEDEDINFIYSGIDLNDYLFEDDSVEDTDEIEEYDFA